SAARQAYAAAAGADPVNATNQVATKSIGAAADSTSEAYERYPTAAAAQPFPSPAVSAPAAMAPPPVVPAPVAAPALAPGGGPARPPPPQRRRGPAAPVTVAHSQVKADAGDAVPAPEPPSSAPAQAFQGQPARLLVTDSEEPASGLFPQLGALLGGSVRIDLL